MSLSVSDRPAVAASARFAAEFAECFGAFEAEFSFTYNALRRHGINESDAEDLVQEVFLVMWRRWEQYDRSRPIRPWLAGIAFRVAYNHRQRLGREVPGGLIDREDDTPDPEQRLAVDSARSMVRRVLASLPEKHRSLILAHDVDGTTVREIAERLEVPIPTAHTRLRAARRAFAKTWKRLLAISGTKARIAPLLAASKALDAAAAEEETPPPPQTRRRSMARARAVLPFGLLPRRGEGLGTHLRRQHRPGAGLWKAWLPVTGSLLFGAILLSNLASGLAPAAGAVVKVVEPATPAHAAAPPAPVRSFVASLRSHGTLTRTTLPLPPESPSNERTRSLGQGLIGYWRFDDGPGSPSARDWSGNGNDCHLRHLDPATTWGEGRLGGGVTLGGQGWLECPNIESLARMDREMTLSLWVRRSGAKQGVRALVTRQFADGDLDTFHLGFRNDDIALRSRIKGGPVFAAFPRARGQWHHVVATLDGQGLAQLFVDGELVRKKLKEGRPSLHGGSNALIVGGGINGPRPDRVSELFEGQIDELAVYDRALRADEIQKLAQGAQPALSP
jgi:RNA polymerase sigma-70 factor (ECF subfamily)